VVHVALDAVARRVYVLSTPIAPPGTLSALEDREDFLKWCNRTRTMEKQSHGDH